MWEDSTEEVKIKKRKNKGGIPYFFTLTALVTVNLPYIA